MGRIDDQIAHLKIVYGGLSADDVGGKIVNFSADFGGEKGDLVYAWAGGSIRRGLKQQQTRKQCDIQSPCAKGYNA